MFMTAFDMLFVLCPSFLCLLQVPDILLWNRTGVPELGELKICHPPSLFPAANVSLSVSVVSFSFFLFSLNL